MNKPFEKYIIDSILIFTLVALSGSAAFFAFPIGYYVFLPIFLFIKRKKNLPLSHVLFLIFIGLLIFLQSFHHSGNANLYPSLIQISSMFTIYLISRLVATNFSILFRKIIVVISVISLVFWAGIQISDSFHDFFLSLAKSLPQLSSDEKYENLRPDQFYHLYIYTIHFESTFRNSGMFFEPGRFAVFIGLALAISLFYENKKIFDKENVIYILTMITTFSTTGYYLMFFLIFFHFFVKSKKFVNFIISLLLLVLALWLSTSLNILSEKVTEDMNSSESSSRFFAIFYHFTFIVESPYIGWGFFYRDLELSPNGLTMVVLRWGIIFSIAYYYLLYRGLRVVSGLNRMPEWKHVVVFLSLLILSFSQTTTVDAFYYAIMFLGLNNNKREINYVKKNNSLVRLPLSNRNGSYK
jgi:hypothetical protein